MTLTLVVMAAGLGSRFGGPKQLLAVGPAGETLLDYAVYDAVRAGFARVVLVVRDEIAAALAVHAAAWFGGVPVTLAAQRLDDLPAGYAVPAGRAKPWGTSHAVLAARAALDGPFAVCNADDFYGAAAYRALADHLRAADGSGALAGYRLDETLSPHGAVARGVCETDGAGWLARIVEVPAVQREGAGVVGRAGAEGARSFRGDAPTSMNLWAFPPAVPALLAEGFRSFLDRSQGAAAATAEYLLSTAVNELVAAGRLRLRVVPVDERWCGMTYAADVPAVRERLAALVRAGAYPADLRTGFARL